MKIIKYKSVLYRIFIFLSSFGILSSFDTSSNFENKMNSVQQSNSKIEKYAWLYKFAFDSDNQKLISDNKKMGITNLFVSVNPNMLYPSGIKKSDRYTASLIDFMNKAKEENIKLHLMIFEKHTFALTENHWEVSLKMQQLVDFLNNNPSYLQNPIVGIHSDVEPHAIGQWHKAKDYVAKEKIMKQYIQMLSIVRNLLNTTSLKNGKKLSSLQFSAAIATWIDSKARNGELPSGSPQNLNKFLDFIVPMTYLEPDFAKKNSTQKKIEKIIENVRDEIDGCPTVIGLDVDNFDSYDNISDVTNKLNLNFKDKPNYKGVCYFRYASIIEFYNKK